MSNSIFTCGHDDDGSGGISVTWGETSIDDDGKAVPAKAFGVFCKACSEQDWVTVYHHKPNIIYINEEE